MMIADEMQRHLFEILKSHIFNDEEFTNTREWVLFGLVGRLETTLSELELCISEIESANALAPLSIRWKYYHIAWVSITDQLAILTSEVFDLGIHHRDVKMFSVLRNRKVEPALRVVVTKYEKLINEKQFRQNRNQLVHQGVFDQQELEMAWDRQLEADFQCELNGTESIQAPFHEEKLKIAVELSNHLDMTRYFLREFVDCLTTHLVNATDNKN